MSDRPASEEDWERWEAPLVGARRSGPAVRDRGDAGSERDSRGSETDASGEPVTAAEIESLQEQAWSEAWEKGYEEGRKAGKKDLDKELKRVGQVLKQLSAPLDDLDEQVEQELVELAVAIARQVIYRELRTDPGQIVAVVRESVEALPSSNTQIEVRLHPADAELLREEVGDAEDGRWTLIEDGSVERGGCVVSDHNSRVDSRLEQQVGRVVAEILGEQRGSEAPAEGADGESTAPEAGPEQTTAGAQVRGEDAPPTETASGAPEKTKQSPGDAPGEPDQEERGDDEAD